VLPTPASQRPQKKLPVISSSADLELLHKRFGHASIEAIVKGLKDKTINGYTVEAKRTDGKYSLQNGVCDKCMLSKSHLPAFPNSFTVKGRQPGDYIVCDIQGPYSIESMNGERYVLTYTDFYSRYSWTYLLHNKSEAFTHLKHLVEVVFPALRITLRHYHSDGAGELTSKETRAYLERTVHATMSVSEVYTPQRNSIAERKFRTLGEMAAAMLYDSSLPHNFWGHAYLCATYIRNRIPITTIDGITKTPYELVTGEVPNIRHLRRWGCKCYPHIPKALRPKDFSYKCHIGFLVGYTDTNSYNIYVPAERKVIKPTVAVVFDENIPSHKEAYFDELTKYKAAVDITNKAVSTSPEDYEYLIGMVYTDTDNYTDYVTTRIEVDPVEDWIVTYRVPLLTDKTKSVKEEKHPIHVGDVVRMVEAYQRIHGTSPTEQPTKSQLGSTTVRSQSPSVSSRPQKSLINSSGTRATDSPTPTACSESNGDSNTQEERLQYSKRARIQRIPMNVCKLGNVANHSQLDDPFTFSSIYNIVHEIDDTPKNYRAAMHSKQATEWQAAIDAEIKALLELGTWEVVDIPPKVSLKTCAFIFKKKYTGNLVKYKARLVAHGYRQIYGLDYWETYAPVSSASAIRTILTIAVSTGKIIHQMDIDTAFLNADLEEDIYMSAPDGIVLEPGKCLLLKKSLYGLKQSPRNFNKALNATIISLGFKRSITEPCVYKQTIDGHETIIAIYVDDLIIACDDINIIERVKQQIAATYKVKDMGEMNWYLGMRFIRNKETNVFTLNQSKYAQDVLDRFAPYYRNSSYRAVPMMPGSNLSPWNENYYASLSMDQYNEVQNFPYRQVVGSLLYLAIWTRPDMAYAVNKVAKHSHNPTLEAVRACKWLLEYLNSTREKGLEFHNGPLTITGYVDSSFGDDLATGKSTYGYIIYLGTTPISWDTSLSPTSVTLSTAEAEYIGIHYCAKAICGHNNFLLELGYPQTKISIYEDNKASITMALQLASTHRCKHISINLHFVRDLIEKGFIEIFHIPTKLQVADMLTKALSAQVFPCHIDTLLGKPPTGDLLHYLTNLLSTINAMSLQTNTLDNFPDHDSIQYTL
jgi:hypothetical protein